MEERIERTFGKRRKRKWHTMRAEKQKKIKKNFQVTSSDTCIHDPDIQQEPCAYKLSRFYDLLSVLH